MAAEKVVGRVRHHPGRHRVEMDIRQQVFEVPAAQNEPGLVATLPEGAFHPAPQVVLPGDSGLDSGHGTPQRAAPGLDDEVVVVGHEAPGQDRELVEARLVRHGIDPASRFHGRVEDVLAAADPGVDVVGPVRDEETDSPRHGHVLHAWTGLHPSAGALLTPALAGIVGGTNFVRVVMGGTPPLRRRGTGVTFVDKEEQLMQPRWPANAVGPRDSLKSFESRSYVQSEQ